MIPGNFILFSFGGAGGLHAADLARGMSIPQVLVPPMASTLSAFGMLVADIVKDYSQTVMLPGETALVDIERRLAVLAEKGRQEVRAEGVAQQDIAVEHYADLRYSGQSFELTIPFTPRLLEDFHTQHKRLYGYARPEAAVEIVNLRVRAVGQINPPDLVPREPSGSDPSAACLGRRRVVMNQGEMEIPFYRGEALMPGNILDGPAIVVRNDTTVFMGVHDQGEVDALRESSDYRWQTMSSATPLPADPIRLEIFKHIFASIAEEMGVVLRKSSYSPNIKERRDYSCALFDSRGRMVAQAAHIPVHLGSMPLSVLAAIEKFADLRPGDAVLLNDPFRGGTHLPDLTLVSPVYLPSLKKSNRSEPGKPFGYVASRAHHADVGGMTPGSMPIARELFQEGLIIPPVRLVKAGKIDSGLLDLILANVRTPQERLGDIYAQVASNQRGVTRLQEITTQYGPGEITEYMGHLLAYSEKLTRELLQRFPDGVYTFIDYLDDDGVGDSPVPIHVEITVHGDRATVDFSGSAPQQKGGINAVYAITLSAVQYVFRSLLGMDAPNNAGCMVPCKSDCPAWLSG